MQVRSWLDILEKFFLVFSVQTWTGKISRAIRKERKYYLWDYARIDNDAAKFENMVACELWRAVTLWTDLGLGDFSLHFIKDKEKRAVDFVVARNGTPFVLVETKLSTTNPAGSLTAFQNVLGIPAVQLNNDGEGYRIIRNGSNNILIAPAWQWLSGLS